MPKVIRWSSLSLTGCDEGRRVFFKDAPDDARKYPYKLNDLYLEYAQVRDLVLNHGLARRALHDVLGGAPMVCNTINFEWGPQKEDHFDTFYMPPREPNRMVAAWIALEDVSPHAGPLRYYPGSHKIPPFLFSHGKTDAIPGEMPNFRKYIARDRTARPEAFNVNSFDVVNELYFDCASRCFLFSGHFVFNGSHADRTKANRDTGGLRSTRIRRDPPMGLGTNYGFDLHPTKSHRLTTFCHSACASSSIRHSISLNSNCRRRHKAAPDADQSNSYHSPGPRRERVWNLFPFAACSLM